MFYVSSLSGCTFHVIKCTSATKNQSWTIPSLPPLHHFLSTLISCLSFHCQVSHLPPWVWLLSARCPERAASGSVVPVQDHWSRPRHATGQLSTHPAGSETTHPVQCDTPWQRRLYEHPVVCSEHGGRGHGLELQWDHPLHQADLHTQ